MFRVWIYLRRVFAATTRPSGVSHPPAFAGEGRKTRRAGRSKKAHLFW